MLRTCRTPLLAAFALLGAALARPALAQGFTVTDLGTLGGTTSHAFAISQQSHIVGSATTSGGATHAFFFNGTISDLGTLPGGTTSAAFGLNGIDQAAGQATTSGGAQHAVLFEGGSLFDLGTFGGATSIANAINNNGASVGGALNAGGAMHAFLHTGTGALAGGDDLGTLGGANSQAFALNDSNVVGGQSDTATAGVSHGFLWDSVNLMQDVGTLGGSNSAVLGLNGVGQASGLANTASGAQHAFFLDSGVMTDLGTLGGTNSQGNAINNNEQVVGQSDTSTSGVQHAFVWDPTNGMVDLNTLLPTGSGWVLTSATGIDDAGEIVGFGSIGGNVHAFLLEPIRATVTLNPDPVFGGQHSTLTVTLPNPAPPGGTSVSLSTSNGGLAVFANNGSSSSSMTIGAGATSATTIVDTAVVGSSQNVTISTTPSGQSTVNSTLTLNPLLESITLRPATVVGSQNATLTVTLNAAVPFNVGISLSTSNGNLAVFDNNGSSSSSITIGAGAKSAQAVIDTGAVAAGTGVTISASLAGLTLTRTLTLTPWLKSLALNPTSVVGGSMQCTGTVTLFAPSQSGGVTVSLTTSDGSKAWFDNNGSSSSSVTVPKGATSVSFVIDTAAQKSNTSVTIKASLGNLTLQQNLTITPWLKSMALNPKTIIGGCQHTTGTIILNAAAPPGGVTVSLGSNDGNTAWFDNNGSSSSSINIPAGSLSATFVVDTAFVGVNKSPTITASLAGLAKTAKLTVTPALSGASLSPSTIIGGCQHSTLTVTLAASAPPGGVGISLSTSNGSLAVFDNNGSSSSSITIPAGATSATLTIDTAFVSSSQQVTITATLAGLNKTATLTLQAAHATLSLSPTTVVGGCQQSTGTVTLNAPAPPGGVGISLSTSNGSLAVFDNNGSSSSNVTIGAGATSASFLIDTGFVASNSNVTISSSFNGGTKSTVLTLTPALISFTLNTNSVTRGTQVTGTVTLAATALGNVGISLSTSNGSLAVFDNNGSSSSSVTVPAGSSTVTFVIDTSASNTGQVTISATLAGLTLNQTLTIN
ncbi:MAG TPA: hypothetical protein VKU00_13255 [Chthonomonadaceae bacterium]|nr:hypothetical protein [Chthonomonadaceae bacterium]